RSRPRMPAVLFDDEYPMGLIDRCGAGIPVDRTEAAKVDDFGLDPFLCELCGRLLCLQSRARVPDDSEMNARPTHDSPVHRGRLGQRIHRPLREIEYLVLQ